MNICEDLNDFIKELDDRIAYFGMTSKIETYFRDQFAYFLHKKYNNKIISREYTDANIKRADIVVLSDKGEPEIILEFKACYAFDLAKEKINDGFIQNEITKDYKKHIGVRKFGIKTYCILLSMNPHNLPFSENIYGKTIKYFSQNKKFLEKYDAKNFFDESKENLHKLFVESEIEIIDTKQKIVGDVFGVTNEIFCFILV
jgi:hypothetical protein